MVTDKLLSTLTHSIPSSTKEVLFNLDCKIVAIFGGTGGIGSSIAEEILNTSKVKHLALTGRDITKGRDVVEKLNCTFGSNKSTFFKSDVEDAAQIRGIFLKKNIKIIKNVIFLQIR